MIRVDVSLTKFLVFNYLLLEKLSSTITLKFLFLYKQLFCINCTAYKRHDYKRKLHKTYRSFLSV